MHPPGVPGQGRTSHSPTWLGRTASLCALLATIGAARATAAHHQLAGDYAVAATTVVCLYIHREWRPSPSAMMRAVRRVAGFSYSLYLSHFPLLALVAAVGLRNRREPFDGGGVLMLAAILALALIYAAGIWWCFERHTPAVRRWIAGWTGAPRGLAPATALARQETAP